MRAGSDRSGGSRPGPCAAVAARRTAPTQSGGRPARGRRGADRLGADDQRPIGGCVRPADSTVESKVVSLENGTIVLLACSQGEYSYTHRLFAIRAGQTARAALAAGL